MDPREYIFVFLASIVVTALVALLDELVVRCIRRKKMAKER